MQFREGDSVKVIASDGRTLGVVDEVTPDPRPGMSKFQIWVEITQASMPGFIGKIYGYYPYELEKI